MDQVSAVLVCSCVPRVLTSQSRSHIGARLYVWAAFVTATARAR